MRTDKLLISADEHVQTVGPQRLQQHIPGPANGSDTFPGGKRKQTHRVACGFLPLPRLLVAAM
jgi:hypothetical protein